MKNIMAILILLAVALSAVFVYARNVKGPYYNHGSFRGMPFSSTRITGSADRGFASRAVHSTEGLARLHPTQNAR